MMDLTAHDDVRGHKKLTINQLTEDKKEHWNVMLESACFPVAFENSNSSNRQVNMQVVDGTDWNPNDHPNTMLIPLALTAIRNVDNAITCHYANRYGYDTNDSFQAKISAMITLAGDQTKPVENPCLQVTFDVIKQDMGTRNEQSFGGANLPNEPHVETFRNENANGGLDIPLSQMDRPVGMDEKIVA